MNEKEISEIYEVLSSYKQALDAIIERLDGLEKLVADHEAENARKFAYVDNVLYDQVLNPAQEALEKAEKDLRFEEFSARQGEKFSPILDNIKAIEGKDFDAIRKTFDDFETDNKGWTEDEYVDEQIKLLTEQIENVKKGLGVENLEVKSDEEGTSIAADGEEVTTEEGAEEEKSEAPEIVDDTEIEDSKEEIDALMKELEAYKE